MWIWDPAKERANRAKHGLSLAAGALVLETDSGLLSTLDPHPDGDRWRTVGSADGLVVLFVVHTKAPPDGTGRIISVRKASRPERFIYGQNLR